jgi:TatD DNase family protein
MNLKYIDIHSHLGFEDYGTDQKEVIRHMQEAGVGTIAVGADLASSIDAVKVASENENVWACIGMHPNHNTAEIFDDEKYEELIKNPKVVAVGECGLEYYKLTGNIEEIKKKQKEDFIKQINLAIKYDKPLMLHIRDGEVKGEAFADAYNILQLYQGKARLLPKGGQVKGNVHFFTGKLDMAQKFIELGFTISFVGLITYVRDFDKIIKNVPLESLQAETDAPYVAPVPYRGERNEPLYVIEIYKKIAEIRGDDPEIVRLQLLENAKKMFGI